MRLGSRSIHRVVSDLATADLGDPRRTRRLKRVVTQLGRRPSASLPDAMRSEAELEGAYRLMNNPRVSMDVLVNAYAEATAHRVMGETGPVLAIHDTTSCSFAHADPEEVGYLNTGKPGLYLHYTLAVALDSRRPLGVLHAEATSRAEAPRKRTRKSKARSNKSGSETRKNEQREYARWSRGIEATTGRVGSDVIHVADREADSYALMASCLESEARFIFRVRIARRRAQSSEGECGQLGDLMAEVEGTLAREVPLASRRPRPEPRAAKSHPPRKARLASLRFSAAKVQLNAPQYLRATHPAGLSVNVVRVWEPAPPDEEKPVEWLLYTTEAIDTEDQVAQVVDAYRARWLIEECNKALKSGCLVEQRQFESKDALLTFVAMCLPIACEILALRARSRENGSAPAAEVLSRRQLTILRRLGSRKLPDDPTVQDALLAVAAMGGHQRSNGDPGWLVLQRGMNKLLDYELGWVAARAAAES